MSQIERIAKRSVQIESDRAVSCESRTNHISKQIPDPLDLRDEPRGVLQRARDMKSEWRRKRYSRLSVG